MEDELETKFELERMYSAIEKIKFSEIQTVILRERLLSVNPLQAKQIADQFKCTTAHIYLQEKKIKETLMRNMKS